ncbi:MAG: hypothetical protein Q4E12_01095 [Coriobacteriia bacterium]|nr:hypothetical protein [Coriobacteriia bacterium]
MEKQTFGNVFFAEFSRIIRKPSMLIAYALFAFAAIVGADLVHSLMVSAVDMAQDQMDPATAAESMALLTPNPNVLYTTLEGCAGIMVWVAALYCIARVCIEHNDTLVRAELIVVPNRTRLFFARLLAWVCASGLLLLAAQLLCLGYTLAVHGSYITDFGLNGAYLAGSLLLPWVCGLCVVALCFGLATLVRSAALSMIAYFCLASVLSTVLSGVAGMLPQPLCTVVQVFSDSMLGNSLGITMGVTAQLEGPYYLMAWGGMIVWTVGLIVLAFVRFKKSYSN